MCVSVCVKTDLREILHSAKTAAKGTRAIEREEETEGCVTFNMRYITCHSPGADAVGVQELGEVIALFVACQFGGKRFPRCDDKLVCYDMNCYIFKFAKFC